MKFSSLISVVSLLISLFLLFNFAHSQNSENNDILDRVNVAQLLVGPVLDEYRTYEVTVQVNLVSLAVTYWYEATCLFRSDRQCRFLDNSATLPESQKSRRNINIALAYASYRATRTTVTDEMRAIVDPILNELPLNYSDTNTRLDNPAGIGNAAAEAVVAAFDQNGMNRLGNHPNSLHPGKNYSDYTGFTPTNPDTYLLFPNKWQPNVDFDERSMVFRTQKFITPQLATTTPFSDNLDQIHRPDIRNKYSWFGNNDAFFQQAQDVIDIQAANDDKRKMVFEFWDDKLSGPSVFTAKLSQSISQQKGEEGTADEILTFIDIVFIGNRAAFDGLISTWNAKTKYNSVRPFSVINKYWKGEQVPKWDSSTGKLIMVDGSKWESYGYTDAHPEYPSATTCFCYALTTSIRSFLGGNDTLPSPFTFTFPAGSSVHEPGVTPSSPTTIVYHKFSEIAAECGISRVWGGVHFVPAVQEAEGPCTAIGNNAFQKFAQLINSSQ